MRTEDDKDGVQDILKALKQENPFENSRPGKKWLQLFLNRHLKICKRQTEIISKARASVTEEMLRSWFD